MAQDSYSEKFLLNKIKKLEENLDKIRELANGYMQESERHKEKKSLESMILIMVSNELIQALDGEQ